MLAEVSCLENLKKTCQDELKKRKLTDPEYAERLEDEFVFIEKLDRAEYIVSIAERVARGEIKKKKNPNGLVYSLLLGVTDVDPIKENIPVEKYLSDPPDIDLDFSDDAKEMAEPVCVELFGAEHTMHIPTVSLFAPKSVLKDLCRAMSLTNRVPIVQEITDEFEKNVGEDQEFGLQIDRFIADKVPHLSPDVRKFLDEPIEFKNRLIEEDKKLTKGQLLFKYARKLIGQVRHFGKHASGTVISSTPLRDFAPTKRVGGDILLAIQEGGHAKEVTMMGCLKYDLLGVRNLSKHVDYFTLARRLYGIENLYERIVYTDDHEDPETIKVFGAGDVSGIFQMDKLAAEFKKCNVRGFEDVIAYNALNRPAAKHYFPIYQKYSFAPDTVKYQYPALKQALQPTYGIITYQEQVMEIFQTVGGFTGSEADAARGMLKKLSRNRNPDVNSIEYFEYQKALAKFRKGAEKNGIGAEAAQQLVVDLSGHQTYSFNRAHSVSYSVVAYIDAFFKAHFPVIYYKVTLDYEGTRENVYTYINDARRHGVQVRSFDLSKNGFDYEIDVRTNEILIGFKEIKNVRKDQVKQMVKLIQEKKPQSILDCFFLLSFKMKQFPSAPTIEPLIKLGAFSFLEPNRRKVFKLYELFVEYLHLQTTKTKKMPVEKLLALTEEINADDTEDYDPLERGRLEYEYLKMYLFDSPIDYAMGHFKQRYKPVSVSRHNPHENDEYVVGIILESDVRKTKTGKDYLNLKITDHKATISVKVWDNSKDRSGAPKKDDKGNLQPRWSPKLEQTGSIICARLSYQPNFNSYNLDSWEHIPVRIQSTTFDVLLFCDGASRGNPGASAIGAVAYRNNIDIPLIRVSEMIEDGTNNQAEYEALIRGLEELLKLKIKSVEIRMDSQLVVRQIQGKYSVESPNMIPLYKRAMDLLELMSYRIVHIPREENSEADGLAGTAISEWKKEKKIEKEKAATAES